MTSMDVRKAAGTGSPAIGIRRSAMEAVVAHARRDAPLECCGLLIGTAGAIEEAIPAVNLRHSEAVYLIDPAAHFCAIRRARREGRLVLGAYHSHPRSPAVPSPTDVEEAHDPGLVHVIVSLADGGAPDVRAYRLEGHGVEEITLTIDEAGRGRP